MSAQHTPGPWRTLRKNPRRVVGSGSRHIIIAGCYTSLSKGRGLAAMQSGGSPDQRTAEANARLIAAAPELLDALEVSMARAYAAGYQHGHEDTVEGQFALVHHVDHPSHFADDVRQMMIDGSLPEASAAIAKTTGKEGA